MGVVAFGGFNSSDVFDAYLLLSLVILVWPYFLWIVDGGPTSFFIDVETFDLYPDFFALAWTVSHVGV